MVQDQLEEKKTAVQEWATERLNEVCEEFAVFPVCLWFMRVLMKSLDEEHFGFLNEALRREEDEFDMDVMHWTVLADAAGALLSRRYIVHEALMSDDTEFE